MSPAIDASASDSHTPAQIESPRVGFVSLGCPKNLVDSEVMMGLLNRGGAQITPRAEDADILVVNTCSFIDSAKQESVDAILEMVQHKVSRGGRAQRLIVAGCLVERYRDQIRANIPEVDAVVGTGELESILQAAGLVQPPANPLFPILTSTQAEPVSIERHASSVLQHSHPSAASPQRSYETVDEPAVSTRDSHSATPSRPEGDLREQQGRFSRDAWDGAVSTLPTYLYSHQTPRILSTPRASAYIKIAEGCDHPCSFCIIPQLRGKFRSRPLASIVAEAQSLIAQGVREITLIGQDTTCYGEDLPPSIPLHPGSDSDFSGSAAEVSSVVSQSAQGGLSPQGLRRPDLVDLLDALAPLPGLHWLRFLYAYPNKITSRLLKTIARHHTIAKYLDVPLQHASADVLRRMKRGGSADRFLQIISQARELVPNLVLRTSFIVGFPGETEADFEELCSFVEAARIDWLGVFSYSDEEGAGAFSLEEKVPRRTIESRRRRLMKLQQKISKQARKQWVGRELEILVEGESDETELLWQGRSLEQAPEIDGKVLINDFGPHESLVPGTFYRARVTASHDFDLVATILE
ncbi:MAG: 30S ribosomal protein S12 methylthiotransferase RimO [Acidobacteriaceae bacterium]